MREDKWKMWLTRKQLHIVYKCVNGASCDKRNLYICAMILILLWDLKWLNIHTFLLFIITLLVWLVSMATPRTAVFVIVKVFFAATADFSKDFFKIPTLWGLFPFLSLSSQLIVRVVVKHGSESCLGNRTTTVYFVDSVTMLTVNYTQQLLGWVLRVCLSHMFNYEPFCNQITHKHISISLTRDICTTQITIIRVARLKCPCGSTVRSVWFVVIRDICCVRA